MKAEKLATSESVYILQCPNNVVDTNEFYCVILLR